MTFFASNNGSLNSFTNGQLMGPSIWPFLCSGFDLGRFACWPTANFYFIILFMYALFTLISALSFVLCKIIFILSFLLCFRFSNNRGYF
jgi:hypothetical protein